MMVKKIILIIVSFATISSAQGYLSFQNLKYYDSEIVSFLKMISKDMGAEKMLVFQTVTKTPEQKNELVTFVVSCYKNKVNVRMITSGFIYSIVELKNSKIFSYKNLKNTGVVSSENQVKNNPSFLNPYNGTDIVMFYSPEHNFYFEHGTPATFKADKNKNSSRKEWTEIIKKELLSNMYRFQRETIYDRNKSLSSGTAAGNKL